MSPLAKKFPPLDERNVPFLHRLEAVVQKAVEDDAAFWVKQEEPSPFRDGGQLGELVIQAVELVLFAAGSKGLFLPALQRGGVPVAVAAALAGFYTVLFLKIEVEQVAAGLPGQVDGAAGQLIGGLAVDVRGERDLKIRLLAFAAVVDKGGDQQAGHLGRR